MIYWQLSATIVYTDLLILTLLHFSAGIYLVHFVTTIHMTFQCLEEYFKHFAERTREEFKFLKDDNKYFDSFLHKERDIEEVMEEMRYISSIGIKEVFFFDQTFAYNRDDTLIFCEKMIKENPSINRKSSGITVKLRMLSFLISNRLYFRKIKNYSRNA